MTLGLCMIVKDEKEVLGRCLQSVQGVFDEIYITDTGSHDNTPRIAAQFTPFVFRFPWRSRTLPPPATRVLRPARTDYIMWLDADDVLLPQARQALLDLKPRLGEADCWYLRYDAAFDAHGNVTLHFRRERIVRRSCGFVWEGAVHETLQVSGTAAQADISVTHLRAAHKEQGRNLRIFARLFADGKTPCSRQKYYFARELEDSGLYDTAACAYEWFLRGSGWAEDKICACRGLARCHAACGRRQEQLEALLRSFAYAPPRAETCCCVGRFFCGRRKLEAGDLLVPPRPARGQSGRGRIRLPRRERLHPLHVAVRVLRQAGRHPPRPRLQRACGALQAAGRKLPAQRALFCLVGTNGARRYKIMICGGLSRCSQQGKATALPCCLYKNARAAIATAPDRSKASGARQK